MINIQLKDEFLNVYRESNYCDQTKSLPTEHKYRKMEKKIYTIEEIKRLK